VTRASRARRWPRGGRGKDGAAAMCPVASAGGYVDLFFDF